MGLPSLLRVRSVDSAPNDCIGTQCAGVIRSSIQFFSNGGSCCGLARPFGLCNDAQLVDAADVQRGTERDDQLQHGRQWRRVLWPGARTFLIQVNPRRPPLPSLQFWLSFILFLDSQTLHYLRVCLGNQAARVGLYWCVSCLPPPAPIHSCHPFQFSHLRLRSAPALICAHLSLRRIRPRFHPLEFPRSLWSCDAQL
jgi:hypothetical protein